MIFLFLLETRQLRSASSSDEPLISLNTNQQISTNTSNLFGKLFYLDREEKTLEKLIDKINNNNFSIIVKNNSR